MRQFFDKIWGWLHDGGRLPLAPALNGFFLGFGKEVDVRRTFLLLLSLGVNYVNQFGECLFALAIINFLPFINP